MTKKKAKVKVKCTLSKKEKARINALLEKLGQPIKENYFDYSNKNTFRSYIYE